jgi:hypothetical protein
VAPYRGVFVAVIWFAVSLSVLRSIMATVAGAAPSQPGGAWGQ